MKDRSAEQKGSVMYIPHGGGPLPLLGGMGHEALKAFLRGLAQNIPTPEEILVISAHWEGEEPSLIGGDSPGLLYDYYGFPSASYKIQYPAPGNPKLNDMILSLLDEKGLQSALINDRGFDHGVFVPLKLIYPEASIPVSQLSLLRGLNGRDHVELGKALRSLLERNILIIGSGFSFHNMQAFSMTGKNAPDAANDAFQNWLKDSCCSLEDPEKIEERLIHWESAPHARYCHPREEHLLPLFVCQGIAGTKGQIIFDDYVVGKRSIAVYWN